MRRRLKPSPDTWADQKRCTTADPAEEFQLVTDSLLELPGVEAGTGFGRNVGLRINGKIFAISTDAGLVLKLPAARCAELVDGDSITPWTAGKARPLKEWVLLSAAATDLWLELAHDAFAYVSGASQS
jgi:hypothetical protein